MAQFFSFWSEWPTVSISRLQIATISAVLLALLGWACWFVVSAYTTDPSATNIKLSGVELTVETQEDLGPSPLSMAKIAPLKTAQADSGLLAFVDESQVTEDLGAPQILGGSASIKGVVTVGSAPIADAIVRVERETNSGLVSIEVTSGAEGQYEVKNIRGGRYRVRAYVPFKYASDTVETVFVEEFQSGEKKLPWKTKSQSDKELNQNIELDLLVKGHTGSFKFETVYPEFAYFGATSKLAVAITSSEIDAEGVIVIKPVPGIKVDLGNAKGYKWVNNQTKNTDADGLAEFSFVCEIGSNGSLPATAKGRAFKLEQVESATTVKQASSATEDADAVESAPVAPTFKRVSQNVSLSKTIVMPACQEYIPPAEESAEALPGDTNE